MIDTSVLDSDVAEFVSNVYFCLACQGLDLDALQSPSVRERYDALPAEVLYFVYDLISFFDV